jgi:hypothetical protein
MKKLMVLIAVTGFVLLSFNVTAFAWDPSGAWTIEGYGDTKMDITCKGDSCSISFNSNSQKWKASCFVSGDKMVCAYNFLTETKVGFILFDQQGVNAMLQKSFDLQGKVAWSGKIIRQ